MGNGSNAVGVAGLMIPALLVISGAQAKLPWALSGFSAGVSILALVACLKEVALDSKQKAA